MELTVTADEGELACLRCAGSIRQDDLVSSSDAFEKGLGPRPFSRQVLLNLEQTTFIDSSGIAWLIRSSKQFLRCGGRLVLHSLSPRVAEVIRILRIRPLLHIASNEAEARTLASATTASR
jgi:anti-anti-sigma factor